MASFSSGQLGPITSGAGRVVMVIGAQKIVPDLGGALRRIEEYIATRSIHEAWMTSDDATMA